jgi:hypothetical protein
MLTIQPKMKVKSSSLFPKYLCPMLYNQIHEAVVKKLELELETTDGFAGTTDHWQARNGDTFQSLSLHYIPDDYTLKKVILQLFLMHLETAVKCEGF